MSTCQKTVKDLRGSGQTWCQKDVWNTKHSWLHRFWWDDKLSRPLCWAKKCGIWWGKDNLEKLYIRHGLEENFYIDHKKRNGSKGATYRESVTRKLLWQPLPHCLQASVNETKRATLFWSLIIPIIARHKLQDLDQRSLARHLAENFWRKLIGQGAK